MKKTSFDIFSGAPDRYGVWLESVECSSSARKRMEAIASEKPGLYFVFSRFDHSVLVSTETFSKWN